MLEFLQTTRRFIAGLLAGTNTAFQRLRHSLLQYFAGHRLDDADHSHSQLEGYGYRGMLDGIFRTEFPQLQAKVYADHAGATLYTQSQIEAIKQDFGSHLFGNPHSQHGWSGNVGSATAVAEARQLTLQMCNAPLGKYECVFTAGATGALKLVGEAFPWQEGSEFVYTQDNHNSVLGIRELALDHGATATCVEFDSEKGQDFHFTAVSSPMRRLAPQHCKPPPQETHRRTPSSSSLPPHAIEFTTGLQQSQSSSSPPSSSSAGSGCSRGRAAAQTGPCLFAFPLESNFSGARYAPAVVNQIQTSGLTVASQEAEERRQAGQHEEEAGEPGQEEAAEKLEKFQSGLVSLSGSDSQHHHTQPHDEVEAEPAVQGPVSEEDHQQHQSAATQAKGPTSDQTCKEEDAEMASTRPSQSEGARWHVLIDAAKGCATCPPDLTKHPADFVALSYYKIFGYPTGLGALLVHKRAVPLLKKRKRYFGGGTVAASLATEDFVRRREGAAGLEDGTAHYLGIAALTHGFRQLASLGGFPAIACHTQVVTRLFVTGLSELRHANGTPLCVLYGAHHPTLDQPSLGSPGAAGQGPVVTFNLLRPDRSFVGYREVEKLAGLHSIFLRTGCFCNPGACARHLGLTASQLKQNYEAGHVCWDDHDIIDGRPTGAVRVSFGWMSSVEDVEAIMSFLKTCFLNSAPGAAPHSPGSPDSGGCYPNRQHLPVEQTLQREVLDKSSGRELTSPVADCQSPACSKASMGPVSDHGPQSYSPATNGKSQQQKDHLAQTELTTPIAACVIGFESSRAARMKQSRVGITSMTDPHTHAQEVTLQTSSRSDWLRQLPWVRCGDAVTAWPASKDESQRLALHSQATTSSGSGVAAPPSSSSLQVAASQGSDDTPATPPPGTPAPKGGQVGVQPLLIPAPPSKEPAQLANLVSEPASQSVLQSDIQPGLDSQTAPSSSQHPTSQHQSNAQRHSDSQHLLESQAFCSQGSLEGIWVYPIKSCGGIRVSEWPLGPNGLLLDREWALVGDDGHVLTQKVLPKLALVQPRVDLQQGFMQISSPTMDTDLLMPLPLASSETSSTASQGSSMHVLVCADHVCSLQAVASDDVQQEVRRWFQQALGVRCCLVRQRPASRRAINPMQSGRGNSQDLLGFANEGQFLLMNSASLADMNARITALADSNTKPTAHADSKKKKTVSSVGHLSRFRPNLLVGGTGMGAYEEDKWVRVCIGTNDFSTAGRCARCEMICMDQNTAVRTGPEPLLTLATYRRQKGRIFLGILLGQTHG